jgi:hypothetical protein
MTNSHDPKQKPIDRAIAKRELERINDALEEPHLLIGGLAVQQFHAARDSKDIDLVCEFETARALLDRLYPSKDWTVENKQEDEYRPSYQIKHKVDELGTIIFGPKISERAPYDHIDWNALERRAQEFRSANGPLKNILVPAPHALAYTKLISFLGRKSPAHKIEVDLKDLVNLTNHGEFSASQFYDLLRQSRSHDELIANFRAKCEAHEAYSQIVSESSLLHLALMFAPIHTERRDSMTVSSAGAESSSVSLFRSQDSPHTQELQQRTMEPRQETDKSVLAEFIHRMGKLIWEEHFDPAWKLVHAQDYQAERNIAQALDQFFQEYYTVTEAVLLRDTSGEDLSVLCDNAVRESMVLARQAWSDAVDALARMAAPKQAKRRGKYSAAAAKQREGRGQVSPEAAIAAYQEAAKLFRECL